MHKAFKSHLALFVVNTMYAASYLFAKGVMPKFLSPTVFISFRACGAALLFWTVRSLLKIEKIEKNDWFRIILCGFSGVAVNQLFIYHGLALTSSINAGMIMTSNPIFVFILSVLFLKEKANLFSVFGLFIGISGAILLILSDGNTGGGAIMGNLFIFINSLSYAIYLILSKPLMAKYKPITVVTWVFTFGSLFVLLMPNLYSEFSLVDFEKMPSLIIYKIIFIVVGVTFLTYLLTLYGVKNLGPTISSAYIYLQPIMVIILAYLFYNFGISEDYTNTFEPIKILYMAMIIIGVYFISRKKTKAL